MLIWGALLIFSLRLPSSKWAFSATCYTTFFNIFFLNPLYIFVTVLLSLHPTVEGVNVYGSLLEGRSVKPDKGLSKPAVNTLYSHPFTITSLLSVCCCASIMYYNVQPSLNILQSYGVEVEEKKVMVRIVGM